MSDYGYAVEVPEGYDEAVVRARLALKGEGFSIITEMHVGGMLGPQAGEERQYLIMGAWTPPAGHRSVDGSTRCLRTPRWSRSTIGSWTASMRLSTSA